METKHTPGPWQAKRNGYSGGQYDVNAQNGRGKLICETSGHDSDANARLISSAPDLLWYLQELTESVQTLAKRHGYQTPQCLPQALAAIAKATGKE